MVTQTKRPSILRRNNSSNSMTMPSTTPMLAILLLCLLAIPSVAPFQVASSTTTKAIMPSSTTTSLRYTTLEQVSDFYQNFPIQSAVLTCGVKASVAHTIAQVKPQIEEKKNNRIEDEKENNASSPQNVSSISTSPVDIQQPFFDWEARRNLAYVLYGGIFVGFLSHIEYNCLFPVLFGTEHTLATTIKEVLFDNLLAAPTAYLPPAYFIKAWIYGSEDTTSNRGIFEKGLQKYLVDVKENQLLNKYWTIWFPAQSISFSVIPDHLRVVFMASVSFFWFILFSTVSSQGENKKDVPNTTAIESSAPTTN